MEDGIALSKEHGINAALAKCAMCGKETGEIALLGKTYEWICKACGSGMISLKRPHECSQCGASDFKNAGEFDGWRGVSLGSVCDECKEILKKCEEEVEKGGVYFKCHDCESFGVFDHNSPIAIDFLKEHGPGAGIELTKDVCPHCREQRTKKLQ